MQDRFKFKIWDKEQKRFFSFDDFKKYEVEFNFDPDTNEVLCEYNDARYVVIQCTGLKDKTGKLIYEGDIVIQHQTVYSVNWSEGSFCFLNINYVNFTVDSVAPERQVIIGNIYENPELLEVENADI